MPVSISGTTGYAGPLGAITVDTGSIVNNAVTPAKMSRTGSSGQVLTSNGAGADPSYQSLPAGGVTSAVAGNGIAVSAATGAVTFSVAVPTYGSIGSYIMAQVNTAGTPAYTVTAGSNYAAGTGRGQVTSTTLMVSGQYANSGSTNNLSGTWRWFGGTHTNQNVGCCSFPPLQAIAVRIA